MPWCIPARLGAAPVVGDPSVSLGAEGVRNEIVASAAIKRGVDHDGDSVISEQIGIALCELGCDRLGIPCSKRHVEVTGVVQHQRVGVDIRLVATSRLVLDETRHHRGSLPLAVTHVAVDDRRLRDPCGFDVE